METRQPLVLASGSPRRRELLAQAGYRFTVRAADIDETQHVGEASAAYVQRLALEKARAVRVLAPGSAVIGADTTVVLDGAVLGKPADVAEARSMLRQLSGRVHAVHTGYAVIADGLEHAGIETTLVRFAAIEAADLERYLATGDSMDKAGAYGIQGYAARWIDRIEGDYFNVMGLPIAALVRVLRTLEL
jgi:septum formation protein